MSNGDNNVWAATSSEQGDSITYLNAKHVTISRGTCIDRRGREGGGVETRGN